MHTEWNEVRSSRLHEDKEKLIDKQMKIEMEMEMEMEVEVENGTMQWDGWHYWKIPHQILNKSFQTI